MINPYLPRLFPTHIRSGFSSTRVAERGDAARWRGRCARAGLVRRVPTRGLAQSDWIIGRNVQIDIRWATDNVDAVCRHAAELAAFAPDVILTPNAWGRRLSSPSHITGMTPRPSVLDQQVRSGDHDPGNDREDAGEQHDVDNESGHGTHPFTEATLVPAITGILVGASKRGCSKLHIATIISSRWVCSKL